MAGRFMQVAANRDYSKSWQGEGTLPWMMQQPKDPIWNESERPISTRENYLRCVKGEKPYWMPAYSYETNTIWPDAIEEHPVPEVDGYDWWGVYWVMGETAGGMITKPGTRTIYDFANWEQDVEWPDLSVVDFETDGKKLRTALDPHRIHMYESVEGITERLHEMMPFDECLLAFYEEPEALERFNQKMADYKIECCEKIFAYYGDIDGVLYHDDWGTQRAGFYSNEMFREQIMPAHKRLFDWIKSQGKFIELHSCGRNQQYVPEMIELGIDMWMPQLGANDNDFLHETYGKDMTFCFPLEIPVEMSDDGIREAVHEFVEHYGCNGRVMPWIMTDYTHPGKFELAHQEEVARTELYRYSLAYYNKLYGRE